MTRGILVTGVMGGMIAATLLGIFFVPLFFTLVARLSAPAPALRDEGLPEVPGG
ncbi:hypothetical protein [Mesorhizobium sp. M0571]|uniref:hypothetical protein n=1 Tax=Mesorhizobium sp. M0571 TaxID=2956960 RepID=UPI003337745A